MQRFQTGSGFLRHHALQGLLMGVLAFCSVLALVLVDLAISRRSASELMSETAQAVLGAARQSDADASSGNAWR